MKIDEIIKGIDIKSFCEDEYTKVKSWKALLSNSDKKDLKKVLAGAKKAPKEKVLQAVICYSIWEPDEAIKEARRKGIFRYKVFGIKGRSNAKFYLSFLLKHVGIFKFSDSTVKYLIQKNDCEWLEQFYDKSEKKIHKMMEDHYKKRIRKVIHNVKMESALFKELFVYIDMLFFIGPHRCKGTDVNTLDAFTQEDIAEGVSYLLFLYIDRYGISADKNYIVDTGFVSSETIEELILSACQINYMQETELLIDFYDYDISMVKNDVVIRSRDVSLEKSIQLAYIKQKMQETLFYGRSCNTEDGMYLKKASDLILDKIGECIVEKVADGILSRYRFKLYTPLIEKIAEQNMEGKIEVFKEEALEIEHFAKEMCMTTEELYEKKITEHCNLYDILLCQRFFRFVYYMQSRIYEQEKEFRIIAQSLIPTNKKEDMIYYFTMFLKDKTKAEEVFELLRYDERYKFDIQYTPLINVGQNVMYPMFILAHSNLMRNTIAYSYLAGNKTANDDRGLETLVRYCEKCFHRCQYEYHVYSNLKYAYKGKKGEIDLLVVSKDDILIIECKGPLMPAGNFEMRATFEHIEKAYKQLDLSETAFHDNGFCKKYFKDALKMNWKKRNVRTCIVLGNRLFSSWTGSRHPIRYIYELDTVLNLGKISSTYASWCIWRGESYSHEDLIDFLDQNGYFVEIMNDSMGKYDKTLRFGGRNIMYESYCFDSVKFFLSCDKKFRVLEKDKAGWDELMKKYRGC